jgi:hypothetical protein
MYMHQQLILGLLFADDLAIASFTVNGLEKEIDQVVKYCNVLGVLLVFTMEVYFHSKIQHTTVKYNQQLPKYVRTISQAIGSLACQNSTSGYSPSLNCHLLAPTIVFLLHPL